jgi:hypothetical protein
VTDFTPISMIATVPSLLVGKLKSAIPRGSVRKAIRVIKVPLVRAARLAATFGGESDNRKSPSLGPRGALARSYHSFDLQIMAVLCDGFKPSIAPDPPSPTRR